MFPLTPGALFYCTSERTDYNLAYVLGQSATQCDTTTTNATDQKELLSRNVRARSLVDLQAKLGFTVI